MIYLNERRNRRYVEGYRILLKSIDQNVIKISVANPVKYIDDVKNQQQMHLK